MTKRKFLLYSTLFPTVASAFFFENKNSSKTVVYGEVKVNNKIANYENKITSNDTIITFKRSSIKFNIGKDAYLLRENSKLELSGDGDVVKSIKLLSGAILGVSAGGEKQLITRTATIGIRGTGFYLSHEYQDLYFCLCYGYADVAGKTTIKTTHHESPFTIYEKDGLVHLKKEVMKGHSDLELEVLENMVGRSVPFLLDSEGVGY